MAKPFDQLRERLLQAGIAPRQVRRYLGELSEHLADLRSQEQQAGLSAADAEAAAIARLGSVDELAQAMIGQRQFRSLSARAPWFTYGVAPVVFLAAAWGVALFILATGWAIFLPKAGTPFVPIHGWEILYFGFGKLIYFGAPLLIGWGIAIMAARQRSNAAWLMAGLVLIAWMVATAHVQAIRSGAAAAGPGPVHVGIARANFTGGNWIDAAIFLAVTVLPYLIWRMRCAFSHAA